MKQKQAAFSLIEIMVAVTLLAVIIIGLVTAFNVTQKAMLAGLSQSGSLLDGGSASDMMAREIEQASPVSFFTTNTATNVWFGAQSNRVGWVDFWLSNTLTTYGVSNSANGIGALYRFDDFHTNQIVEGVVAFTVTGLDKSGNPTTNFPRAVLLELGTLDKPSLEHYNSLSNTPLALAYLTNQAAHLHIFRQRISVKAQP